MESRGLELVAERFNIVRMFLKVPFDRVGIETQNFDRGAACDALAQRIDYQALLEQILELV